ncbi:MAG: FAD-binding and (Fe-S)-binding domain-containing protein, partial [Desulfobacterales bacterium]
MPPPSYQTLIRQLSGRIPASRLISDPLRTLAYGTDASFYRLIPKLVIRTENESEVALILRCTHGLNIPVTFRAAGTSLSGQAVTDSVLVVGGESWKGFEILENGEKIRLQPGIIGAQANRYLAPYGRKIGPDPASINAAMVGGIAANNASGMCCGTAQNSYKTISSLRVVLSDGSLLDTGDAESRRTFAVDHGQLLEGLRTLGAEVRANETLAARIAHKYKIKNTMGYSLNALVDYEDPFDILTHLMIGSEGTLGFMSEIVYSTVVEHAHKASALMVFPEIETACRAAAILNSQPVTAVELMDRAALRSVEGKPGMPAYLQELSQTAAALLVETRANDPEALAKQIAKTSRALSAIALERPIEFTDQVTEYTRLWNIRKGLFPAVGAVRRIGTTVIIEDVAFPIHHLAPATLELRSLMAKHRYDEAIIFGHALEGNLHFVFTQDFSSPAEVERYRAFMHDVCRMVVEGYDGSLKAEHGTGRNMAPYLEMEWGREAYGLMERIKALFDPTGILNPGVILDSNPLVHIENLKPLPPTNALVDTCIECGFCETICPSKNLTLTPRQRIVAQREISRLKTRKDNPQRLAALLRDYPYQGEATCATDGLCALSCPVEINTGELTKALRRLSMQSRPRQRQADWVADHFAAVTALLGL